MNKLGRHITVKMIQLGITRKDLLSLTGLGKTTLQFIFSGKTKEPQISNLRKIAKAIECDVQELIELI